MYTYSGIHNSPDFNNQKLKVEFLAGPDWFYILTMKGFLWTWKYMYAIHVPGYKFTWKSEFGF